MMPALCLRLSLVSWELPPRLFSQVSGFFFVFPGVIMVIADLGAAYGTAKSGVGISSMGVMRPELAMRNIIPVVMAGVLGIYGLIVAVILANKSKIFISVQLIVTACFCS